MMIVFIFQANGKLVGTDIAWYFRRDCSIHLDLYGSFTSGTGKATVTQDVGTSI